MDLSEAISEPFVQLIDFHNAFNRGIKVSYGAMIFLADQTKSNDPGNIVVVPTGSEPWGAATRWRDLDRPLKEASIFISEMGITRAAAAFENYLIDAKSEFDRANLQPADTAGTGASALKRLDALLGANTLAMQDLIAMAEFFDAARNCVVHRSNVASDQLARLRNAPATLDALTRWPKRTGKWTLSLPSVVEDQVVEWQPRHAIFAPSRPCRVLPSSTRRRWYVGSLQTATDHELQSRRPLRCSSRRTCGIRREKLGISNIPMAQKPPRRVIGARAEQDADNLT